MKKTRISTLRLVLPILLSITFATEMTAQIIGPTINYQGRARDADGMPLAGPHLVNISIYDAQSGGNLLFTEAHPTILFSTDGTFTIAIGSTTPSGIPQSVGFHEPRWLGMTVTGFNDNNELPRLRLRGVPYSFEANHAAAADRATIADSADRAFQAVQALRAETAAAAENATTADSSRVAGDADHAATADRADVADVAATLRLPAVLEGEAKEPLVTIDNQFDGNSATGLSVYGSQYAIIANGDDSTTGRIVSGTTVGNTGTPVAGSLYQDNTPMAWGTIDSSGQILTDFGIFRVSTNGQFPGRYEIILDNPVDVDEKGFPQINVVVTARHTPGSFGSSVIFPTWSLVLDGSSGTPEIDRFEVRLSGFEGGEDHAFSVVVFGRPAPVK